MSEHHGPSVRTYVLIFCSLLALTAATVMVAFADLGGWHTTIALAIAVTKATLIVLFFMHGLESSRLVHLIIVGSLLWLAIMLVLTFSDYDTRGLDRRIRTGESFNVSPK